MSHTLSKPLRLLIVCPSWLGDVVMATPALALLRRSLPGSFIGGLVRPGLDELLAGTDFFDELHVDRARGVMGPKLVAAKLRPRRYDAALLLTNSFSTALITRLAFIPRRVGYERDGRGMLLTDKLHAPRRARPHRGWAPISAVHYYLDAARVLLPQFASGTVGDAIDHPATGLQLAVTPGQRDEASAILAKVGIADGDRFAILNPGGNNPAKRWPAERFGQVGASLIRDHGLHILVNGSPGEIEVVRAVTDSIRGVLGPHVIAGGAMIGELPSLGVTIGSLKEIVRRSCLMITNDTGPRHIAAAFATPTIALFGPTDPRWTTLPDSSLWRGDHFSRHGLSREIMLLADPTLAPDEVADDHPEQCRIERIEMNQVMAAINSLLPAAQ
ncbi:MAG: glycosyltransferase family 9 protein [Pyrinomonadaceae bacterium]|nr:glycosyltransferase family 9 protein [Phycisphaerales bacterium]